MITWNQRMEEDVPVQDQISANASNESSITHISESTVLTRLKQKKKPQNHNREGQLQQKIKKHLNYKGLSSSHKRKAKARRPLRRTMICDEH